MIKYYFDNDSLQFRPVKRNAFLTFLYLSGILGLIVVMASIMSVFYNFNYESPRELKLSHEVSEMEFYYGELDKKVVSLSAALTSIEKRDDQIYRMVLGTAPVDPAIRQGGRGGYDRYEQVKNKNLENEALIIKLNERVDKIRRKLYVESLSQDELLKFSIGREKQYAAIPAIHPLSNLSLIAVTSGFGLRVHPIYKVIRLHSGIDFVAMEGTPVYATGDGIISVIEEKTEGYGKMISIDHGFGYDTRYAHLQKFTVRVGQKVRRGERIGFVGNTGLSTAPHLHYEVLVNGEAMNPLSYFFNDVSVEEYDQMISSQATQKLSALIKRH